MIVGAFVLPVGTCGMIEASAMRRPVSPWTLNDCAVDDGGVVLSHPAGADLVVVGHHRSPDIFFEILIGHLGAGEDLRGLPRCQGIGATDLPALLHRGHEGVDVGLFGQ